MDIGFIGLGLMGRPLALHLAQAGHTLHLWARRPTSLDPFKAVDAKAHASPAEVAKHAEIVFTMVADAPDVHAVILGDNGIAAGGPQGLIVVNMSTINPNAARGIGNELAARGIEFLDAPVSGGEMGAINASLTIMVGGKVEVFDKVKPLFEKMGKSITLIGGTGAGQVAKACNQILTGVGVLAVAEAFNFAAQSGVNPPVCARRCSAASPTRASSRTMRQRMLDRNFQPGFKAWMHQKDLRIVMEEAHRLGLMLPAAAATAQLFNAIVGSGMGEDDSIAALKLLETISTTHQ